MAWSNLRRLPAPARQDLHGDPDRQDGTVHVFTSEDFFGASRLLLLDELLAGPGVERPAHGVLLVVPNRHLLAVHVLRGPGVVAAVDVLVRMAAGEHAGRPGPVSPHVYFRAADGRTQQVTGVEDDGSTAVRVEGRSPRRSPPWGCWGTEHHRPSGLRPLPQTEHVFSMLSMSSAPVDLTARARVRDAAIARFGRDGFAASLRAIAADAGVTAGLVVHHFGSKDGLRAGLRRARARGDPVEKRPAWAASPGAMLAPWPRSSSTGLRASPYGVRSLAGGDLATAFVGQMVEDAQAYLAAGVTAGTVRPSRTAARAKYLTIQHRTLMLWISLRPGTVSVDDFRRHCGRSPTRSRCPPSNCSPRGCSSTGPCWTST